MDFWSILAYIGIGIGGATVLFFISLTLGMSKQRVISGRYAYIEKNVSYAGSKWIAAFICGGMVFWLTYGKYGFSVFKSIGIGVIAVFAVVLAAFIISKIFLCIISIGKHTENKEEEKAKDKELMDGIALFLICIAVGVLLAINVAGLGII